MAEEDTKKNPPSLPPNYVSILQLQEQWLKKKQKQKEDESKLKQIQSETDQKNQELAAQKQIRHTQQHQSQRNCFKSNGIAEKSNLGRFQGSNRNYEKGVYKDKGKGKIGEVGEKGVDLERGDGKVRQNGGGGGGFGVVMSLRVVEVEEDENVGVKKQDDGFRAGLTSNVGDLCANNDVSEHLEEGGTMMETKEGLERGKKVDDGAMRVGNKKKGSFRPSRVNKMNVGDSDNVGRREGVEERKEVLQGKDSARISDMSVAIEVGNVGHRSRWWQKKDQNKKGLSMSEFGSGTKQGQKIGRTVREENEIELYLKKEDVGKNGAGDKDDIGGVGDVPDMEVAIELMNVDQKSRGGRQKNRNKKSEQKESRNGFGRSTKQGRGNGRDVQVENGIQLDLENENGEQNVKGSGDNMGDVKDVSNMGVAIEIMNVEQKRKGKRKENRNKKGLFRSEFGRGVEQGQGNGREMEEGNIIQLDLKKENGRKIAEGSGDNIGDSKDVADMGVAIALMNDEQKSRGGHQKNRNKKGLSRSEVGRDNGQGQENGRGTGEENVIQLDLKKVNGGKNGEERNGDNIRDGEGEAEKGARLREWKHNRVCVGRRNVNGKVMGRTRWGNEKWAVKGASSSAEIIEVTVGKKSRTDESVDEIPVVMSEVNEKTNLCSDGSQRNVCDNTVNGEFQDNTIEMRENLKPELFGEHDNNCPLIADEANGESARFRYKTKGNQDGEGFSRPKSRRDFKERSLNIQRVSNRRKNGQMYGHNRRLQKDPWSGEKQRDSGFMWVKKGCNAGADVYEA